jgi:hypothetical protein
MIFARDRGPTALSGRFDRGVAGARLPIMSTKRAH